MLIRTYSLFNLERRDLRRRQVSHRSFDWGMGDGKERYMIKAWGPDKKESKLRSLVNGIYGFFWNPIKVREINVELMFPYVSYRLMV